MDIPYLIIHQIYPFPIWKSRDLVSPYLKIQRSDQSLSENPEIWSVPIWKSRDMAIPYLKIQISGQFLTENPEIWPFPFWKPEIVINLLVLHNVLSNQAILQYKLNI